MHALLATPGSADRFIVAVAATRSPRPDAWTWPDDGYRADPESIRTGSVSDTMVGRHLLFRSRCFVHRYIDPAVPAINQLKDVRCRPKPFGAAFDSPVGIWLRERVEQALYEWMETTLIVLNFSWNASRAAG